ncbi:hypothetical protein TNCV_1380451 [Trichonephila clavipes]|nr:hypothetical protein TNCV_1380451 [Trichonephila clavipes]
MLGRKCSSRKLWLKKEAAKILLKGCTATVVRNYDRNRLTGLAAVLQGMLYVLENSYHVTYHPGSYRYLRDVVFN